MSTNETRLPLREAQVLAETLCGMFGPERDIDGVCRAGAACEEVVIAGSVRRRRHDVGDIEIVVLPRWVTPQPIANLFDEEVKTFESICPELDAVIEYWIRAGILFRGDKNGRLFKQFHVSSVPGRDSIYRTKVDLWIAKSPDNFGNTLTIRTGPADFTRAMCGAASLGGLLPDGMRHVDGYLHHAPKVGELGEIIPCRTEEAFFEAVRVPWIAPEDRTADHLIEVTNQHRKGGEITWRNISA